MGTRSFIHSAVALAAIFLSPPTGAGERNVAEPGSIRSVAIVDHVSPALHYSHRGATAFGNKLREFDNDWDLPAEAGKAVASFLESNGISVVNAAIAEDEAAIGKKCWSTWNGKYKDQCLPELRSLLDRQGVDAIIVLKSYSLKDYYFDSPVSITGFGVHTMGIGEKIHGAVAVSHVAYAIYSRQGPLDGETCSSAEIERGRTFTVSPETMTLDALVWARPVLLDLMKQNAERTTRAAGVVPGGADRCPLRWGIRR